MEPSRESEGDEEASRVASPHDYGRARGTRAGWDEESGVVSRTFNDWYLVDRDQRAFLMLGLEFSGPAFDRIWKGAGEEPGDPDGPDQLEVYERRARGLFPQNYDWMHLSGAFRDAVTNFEVYLEKAKEEVEGSGSRQIAERAPSWRESRTFFDSLGVEIDTPDVAEVRTSATFSSTAGELRTEKMRREYAPTPSFPGRSTWS